MANGKIGYAILVDGEVKDEGVVGWGEVANISVDVKGAKTFAVQILTGGDVPNNDCGSFADAKFTKTVVVVPGNVDESPATADTAIWAVVAMTAALAAAVVMGKKIKA
ncbi:MAG: hypothetical protein E7632_08320 [Ruminococcaceae bacterium]|nr:hypothetical protein [Oscillospiraceae bacterium]